MTFSKSGVRKVTLMQTANYVMDEWQEYAAIPGMQVLARQGQVRHYRKHTLLIQQGDTGHQLYLVMAGRLREYALSNDSRPREITLSLVSAGQLVGVSALDGGPHWPAWSR